MRLLLIRHGESSANAERRLQGRLDYGLSERGRRESTALAARLTSHGIDAVYSSPLRRAWETAEVVVARLGLDVHERPELMERDVGELAGLTGEEIRERFPEYLQARREGRRADIVGFESDESLFERVAACLNEIAGSHRDQRIAVVTHGGVIGAFVRDVLRVPGLQPAPFALNNASITTIDVADGDTDAQARPRMRIVGLNDTCHLDGLREQAFA